MVLAVTLVCFLLDRRAHRASPLKACALGCTGIIALVLVFMYNIAPRHLMLLAILLLVATVVEDAARGIVWLPVLAVVLLPINVERSTLSTYFDEMGSQITAVDMHREDLDGSVPVHYPMLTKQQILWQN